jgi:hypothetical protein
MKLRETNSGEEVERGSRSDAACPWSNRCAPKFCTASNGRTSLDEDKTGVTKIAEDLQRKISRLWQSLALIMGQQQSTHNNEWHIGGKAVCLPPLSQCAPPRLCR